MAKTIRRSKSVALRAAKAKSVAKADVAAAITAEMSPGEIHPALAIETDIRAARDLEAIIGREQNRLKQVKKKRRFQDADQPDRLKQRSALIFPQDKLGLERIVGVRDIVQITFLHAALRAAGAVCRIRVRGETPSPPDFGTGFLVAPGVLLTNHHVLDSPDCANLSQAEFDVELDLNFVEAQPRIFTLLPERLFVTSASLDFTFVAVNSVATDGTPLSTFGFLPLMRRSGKGVSGEYASIIQHPKGETKQIVLRENQIIAPKDGEGVGKDFIHYRSDTEPGSSGAPVFNDQFDVFALHHKAIPAYSKKGERLTHDGKVWTPDQGEDKIKWVANEGVRISAIFLELDSFKHVNAHAGTLLALLEQGRLGRPFSSLDGRRGPIVSEVGEAPPLEATKLANRKGYVANFLGFAVPLPKMPKALKDKVAPLLDGSGHELKYTHFSVVMHAARRTPLFVACNIDGKRYQVPTVSKGWRIDGRIDKAHQSGPALYSGNPFDKGHMVRKLDPAWGSQQEANDGVTDTYHYTNAAPQEHSFNDGLWGDVEDYILGLAKAKDHKITVITGPVLDDSDRNYGENRPGGPWKVPVRFWKVICYAKADGTRSATGFLLDQSDEVAGLLEGLTPLPQAREVARVHQKAVEDIEDLTKLDFGKLRTFDPLSGLEGTRRTRRIVLPANIVT